MDRCPLLCRMFALYCLAAEQFKLPLKSEECESFIGHVCLTAVPALRIYVCV